MNQFQAYLKLQAAINKSPIIPPCQNSDPEVWFPIAEQDMSNYRAAKKLCGICPARKACLEYALIANEQFGIWGGLTSRERDRLRDPDRRREKTAHRPNRNPRPELLPKHPAQPQNQP